MPGFIREVFYANGRDFFAIYTSTEGDVSFLKALLVGGGGF